MQDEFQGYLFSSIGYKSDNDVRNLIENLNMEQSFIFINKAIELAYSQGMYSMIETEIISKSLSMISSKLLTNDTTRQGGNN